jgi:uncharacterized protein YhaN
VRLRSLSLHAFGAVVDRTLDFGPPSPALHLVYGPNEAGKSTTLRALLALLYGVPRETSDGSVYGYGNMRVGATLSNASGRELHVVRRKGTKNTLAAPDGALLDESVLAGFLQHMPEAVFRNMFGLDHAALRQGGEQLRQGKGDLGESLFQASSGGPSIRHVLSSFEQEADKLWKPRGKQEIRAAIERHTEARAKLRAANKGAEAVRSQQREIDVLRARVLELGAQQRALRAEHSAVERSAHLLPLLLQRRELLAARAALGPIVLLPSDATAQRQKAQQELARAETEASRLRALIEERSARRAALDIPESLLGLPAEQIEAVSQELGKHRKAARDLPRVRAQLQVAESELERALGGKLTLEQLAQTPFDNTTVVAVQQRAVELSGLRRSASDATVALKAAQARLATDREALRALMPEPGAVTAIAAARLPHPELVAGLRQAIEALQAADAKEEQLERALLGDDELTQERIDTMQREGAPPTEGELLAARAGRDSALRALQACLGPEQRAFEFGAEPGGAPQGHAPQGHKKVSLEQTRAALSALEREQGRADELADRLRREAARVSELARLLAQRERLARERVALAEARAKRAEQRREREREWLALWSPLGIEPKEPASMHAWLLQVSARLETAERNRDAAEIKLQEAREALALFEQDWARRMERLQLAPDTSVEEALDRMHERVKLVQKIEQQDQLRGRVQGMERDARAFETEVRRLALAHLPTLASVEIERAAEELVRAHQKARSDLVHREGIERELRERQDELAVVEARAAAARAVLAEQLAAARAADLQELTAAEERSDRGREIDRKQSDLEDRLREASDGDDLEALAARLEGESMDRLRARKAESRDELERVAEEHAAAVRALAALEAGLANLESDEAASCAVEVEQQLDAVHDLTRRYVRTRLAADLLALVVRRYRDANQAPMVGHASELFSRLTLGRYPRLDVSYDEQDEPALVCIDADNRVVAVDALSDGTRDQLYLALRLASIARFAERSEPLPLVLDDVLVQFDDARSSAGLTVLAETAAITQVVFFTHHARLVELARDVLPQDRLVVHTLDQSSTRSPTLGSTIAG